MKTLQTTLLAAIDGLYTSWENHKATMPKGKVTELKAMNQFIKQHVTANWIDKGKNWIGPKPCVDLISLGIHVLASRSPYKFLASVREEIKVAFYIKNQDYQELVDYFTANTDLKDMLLAEDAVSMVNGRREFTKTLRSITKLEIRTHGDYLRVLQAMRDAGLIEFGATEVDDGDGSHQEVQLRA